MNIRSVDYGAMKLRDALARIQCAETLHEGLYAAYMEDIQWLTDLPDLPSQVADYLRDLGQQLAHSSSADVTANALKTISELTPAQSADLAKLMLDLVNRLEAIANGPGIPSGRQNLDAS